MGAGKHKGERGQQSLFHASLGPLIWAPCRMPILRNGISPCHIYIYMPFIDQATKSQFKEGRMHILNFVCKRFNAPFRSHKKAKHPALNWFHNCPITYWTSTITNWICSHNRPDLSHNQHTQICGSLCTGSLQRSGLKQWSQRCI